MVAQWDIIRAEAFRVFGARKFRVTQIGVDLTLGLLIPAPGSSPRFGFRVEARPWLPL